jgi:predicted unusual protein kinase regulating ubiquinone biosynthesis (AarF/ABC1/UbiB family)
MWLAEILYGLITGDYRRVAEIHFEAQYVPPHHSVEEFATALRAAGEPIRGLPVKDISVGGCSRACSPSPATSTCRRSRTCCCCRRRW